MTENVLLNLTLISENLQVHLNEEERKKNQALCLPNLEGQNRDQAEIFQICLKQPVKGQSENGL